MRSNDPPLDALTDAKECRRSCRRTSSSLAACRLAYQTRVTVASGRFGNPRTRTEIRPRGGVRKAAFARARRSLADSGRFSCREAFAGPRSRFRSSHRSVRASCSRQPVSKRKRIAATANGLAGCVSTGLATALVRGRVSSPVSFARRAADIPRLRRLSASGTGRPSRSARARASPSLAISAGVRNRSRDFSSIRFYVVCRVSVLGSNTLPLGIREESAEQRKHAVSIVRRLAHASVNPGDVRWIHIGNATITESRDDVLVPQPLILSRRCRIPPRSDLVEVVRAERSDSWRVLGRVATCRPGLCPARRQRGSLWRVRAPVLR